MTDLEQLEAELEIAIEEKKIAFEMVEFLLELLGEQ